MWNRTYLRKKLISGNLLFKHCSKHWWPTTWVTGCMTLGNVIKLEFPKRSRTDASWTLNFMKTILSSLIFDWKLEKSKRRFESPRNSKFLKESEEIFKWQVSFFLRWVKVFLMKSNKTLFLDAGKGSNQKKNFFCELEFLILKALHSGVY